MKTLLALLWLPAAAAAGILELTPGGSLKIDGTATLGLAHYTAKNWTSQTRHADSWRPERDGNTFRGGWKLRGEPTPVRCELHIEQPAPEHWHLIWSLKAAKPVETQTLAVQLELPVEAEPLAALAGKKRFVSERTGGRRNGFPGERHGAAAAAAGRTADTEGRTGNGDPAAGFPGLGFPDLRGALFGPAQPCRGVSGSGVFAGGEV